METLNCFIVDDEEACRISLKNFLSQHCPNIKLIGEAATIVEAVKVLSNITVDIVFLDIQLKKGLSFEIIDRLDNINFDIIFVTAFDTYAIKAFRYSAIDYLLKPINPLELKQAVEKVKPGNNRAIEKRLSVFQNNTDDQKFDKLVISTVDNNYYLNVNNILHFKAEGSYTYIHSLELESAVMSSKMLGEYCDILPENQFIRVHKSYLINGNKIDFVGSDFVQLIDKSKVPLARRRKEMVDSFLKAG